MDRSLACKSQEGVEEKLKSNFGWGLMHKVYKHKKSPTYFLFRKSEPQSNRTQYVPVWKLSHLFTQCSDFNFVLHVFIVTSILNIFQNFFQVNEVS